MQHLQNKGKVFIRRKKIQILAPQKGDNKNYIKNEGKGKGHLNA
jgi:hypothetical protein